MTAEFKVGDKVEYIEDHDGRTAGTKGTVTRAFEGNNLIVVTDEFGAENHALRSRFKHAEKLAPLTYKGLTVGDKVRCTGAYWEGLEGTVSGFNDDFVDIICTKFPDTTSSFSSLRLGKSICATVGGKGVSASDLEKIEPAFKVGDVVNFVGKVMGFEAQTVTVVSIDRSSSVSSTYPIRVRRADGLTCPVREDELEHITKPKAAEVTTIKYADIQVGDKIKRTRTYLSGAVEVREGVVKRKGDGYLSDDSALILAYSEDDSKKGVVLELLERAEPKPEDRLVDGAKIGAQIVVTTIGARKLYRKAKENLWETVVIKQGSVHIGFNWSDKEMKMHLEGSDAKRVGH